MRSILDRCQANGATSYTAAIPLRADGKRVHRESETFPSQALAKEWMTRREAELAGERRSETAGAHMAVAQRITGYAGEMADDNPRGRSKSADLARIGEGALADRRVDRLTVLFIAPVSSRRMSR